MVAPRMTTSACTGASPGRAGAADRVSSVSVNSRCFMCGLGSAGQGNGLILKRRGGEGKRAVRKLSGCPHVVQNYQREARDAPESDVVGDKEHATGLLRRSRVQGVGSFQACR